MRGIQILYLGSTGKSRKLISLVCSEVMGSVGEVVRVTKSYTRMVVSTFKSPGRDEKLLVAKRSL